ncbi:MAG: DUF3644 domain-containing protein [Rhizobium sp.]
MTSRKANSLSDSEASIIKAMLLRKFIPQDIQAYFSRPTRSINHARISDIRDGRKFKDTPTATEDELDTFLECWPDVDPDTGLKMSGDELLIKAREAMIAAVQIFNSGGFSFRAELFIVTSVIAWTYLMHAFYRRENVDYRYRKNGEVELTPSGAEKFWELSQCLSSGKCPLSPGVKNNLRLLIEIRNEIEHRSTDRIDHALGAELQACCINFNDSIKGLFGAQFGVDKRLSMALQFVTFDGGQRAALKGAKLPPNLSATLDAFRKHLTEAEAADPQYRIRFAFLPLVGKANSADVTLDVLKAGSEQASAIERILLKEVERPKFLPGQVVRKMQERGFKRFNMHDHNLLGSVLGAKQAGKGYGTEVAGKWHWYESWIEKVTSVLAEGWERPGKKPAVVKPIHPNAITATMRDHAPDVVEGVTEG